MQGVACIQQKTTFRPYIYIMHVPYIINEVGMGVGVGERGGGGWGMIAVGLCNLMIHKSNRCSETSLQGIYILIQVSHKLCVVEVQIEIQFLIPRKI